MAKASKKKLAKARPSKPALRPAHRANSKATKTRPVARAEAPKPTKPALKPRQVLVETKAVVSRKVVPTLPPAKKTVNHAPPAIIPTPVPTDGKPRKNQAGFSPRELEQFRELLLAKRRELVGDMSSMEREALRSAGTNLSNLPIHMADMGTDNYEQEFTLGLVEKDRQLLREINSALAKIQNGTYGLCEGTGKPIAKARLEVIPWTKYGIEYARQMEKGLIRR